MKPLLQVSPSDAGLALAIEFIGKYAYPKEWGERHRECGPVCCVTGDRCVDDGDDLQREARVLLRVLRMVCTRE